MKMSKEDQDALVSQISGTPVAYPEKDPECEWALCYFKKNLGIPELIKRLDKLEKTVEQLRIQHLTEAEKWKQECFDRYGCRPRTQQEEKGNSDEKD